MYCTVHNYTVLYCQHHLLDPLVVVSHLDIHTRDISLPTPHSPTHQTCQLPGSRHLTDQGTPTVTLTGVLPFLPTSAHKPRVEDKVKPESGILQLPLTVSVTENWKVNLLECVLVGSVSTEGILPPSTDEAAVPSELRERVRKADRGDVGVPLEVNISVQLDDGDVIVEISGVELGVDGDTQYIQLNVRVELTVVVHVPFSQSNPDFLRSVLPDAVCGGEDVGVVDEAAAADVHVVILFLLQDSRLPGILSELGVSLVEGVCGIVDPSGNSLGISSPTLTKGAKLISHYTIELLGLLSCVPNVAGRGEFIEVQSRRSEGGGG